VSANTHSNDSALGRGTMTGTKRAVSSVPSSHADMAAYVRELVLRDLKRSEFTVQLRKELLSIIENTEGTVRTTVKRLIHNIDAIENKDASWNDFMRYFDHIHGGFLTALSARHPDLTETELRISAFLRLPMTSKDVASIMGCSTRSVEKHRERLRKKFGLTSEQRIHEYLNTSIAHTKL